MIYSINKSNEFISLFENFGFNKISCPSDDFFKIATDLINGIDKEVGSLPLATSIFSKKTPKMSDNNGFNKTIEKIKDKIKYDESNDINMNISTIRLSPSVTPNNLNSVILSVVSKLGFKPMRSSGSILKDAFKTFYLYKQIDDNTIAILYYAVEYMTQYGTFAGHTRIRMNLAAARADDKTLKKLNLLKEEVYISSLDEGNNFTSPFKKSKTFTDEELKNMGINTVAINRTEIPRVEINRSNISKINTSDPSDNKNRSKNESCGIFTSIPFI